MLHGSGQLHSSCVKMEYMYADLAGDVKKRFDTSNYKSKEDWTDET